MNKLAQANAANLLHKYYYKAASEIDLEALLYAENLKLKEEPLNDCDGKIVFNDETGIITINNRINLETQKHFTISHEMGHFYNERGKGSFRCGYEEFYGSNRNSVREQSANDFAAELLMHEHWFVNFVKGRKPNSLLFRDTAEYFNVSLSAAAIRYSEIGTHPTAIVFSKEGIVKWVSISKDFRVQFIRCGIKVTEHSYTYDYFQGSQIPHEAEDVPARAWFKESSNIKDDDRVYEFNIPFPNYNSILSVLYFD